MFIALVLAISSITATQSAVAVDLGATSFGGEYDSFTFFEAGLRLGGLKPKRINADGRLTTFPQALAEGGILLSADIEAAYVAPLGKGVVATPRVGFTMLAGGSSEGGGALAGVNFGVGIVAGLTSPVAVRFDFGRRIYVSEEGFGASSFSIGVVWVQK